MAGSAPERSWMQNGVSSYIFIPARLHPGMLDKLAGTGAEAVEVFAARTHFDYTDRQQVRELSNYFKHNPLVFHSVHAPIYFGLDWKRDSGTRLNLVDDDKRQRLAAMDEIKRVLEVAEVAPFRYLIQHLGVVHEAFDPRKFEYALSSIEHLHAFAKPLGVQILVENIPNEITTPERIVELLHGLHLPGLGACFDFGHAHLGSSVREAFAIMRPFILSAHLHDNDKEKDEHLFPGEGTIDWAEAMALLREAPHRPAMVLEIHGEDRKDVIPRFTESFHRLNEAAPTPAGS